MDINKDKLEIKYLLGTYKDDDNYPTVKDLIYQVINFCYLNNSNFISDVDLVKIFKTDDVSSILTILQKENYLLFDKKLKTKTNYKIVKNPFI